MRQHRLANQITNGEDMRHIGAHLRIHGNQPALAHLHTRLVGSQLATIGAAPHRYQYAIEQLAGGNGLTFEIATDAVFLRLGIHHFGLQMHRHALLFQALGQRFDQVGIRARHQLRHEFDHGDVAAQRTIDRGHFQTNNAAAHHQQLLGHLGQIQCVGGIHDARVVPRERRQFHRLAAGGNDALLETQQLGCTIGSGDFQLIGRHEPGRALHHPHFALLGHAGQALGQLAHHAVLVAA